MKTLSDVSMEDVMMGRTGTHLILTERELQVIYRALSQYDSRDTYAGSTTFHETEERVAKEILDNLENMGVKA